MTGANSGASGKAPNSGGGGGAGGGGFQPYSERWFQISDARNRLLFAAMEMVTQQYKAQTTQVSSSKLDDAARAYIAEIDKPDICRACGQEIKPGEAYKHD